MSNKLMPAKLAYLCTGLWHCEDEEATKLLSQQITSFLEDRPAAADSANRNDEDRTPLHYASTSDQCLGLVILLVGKYNVDMNVRSAKGETPLSISRSHRGGKYSSEIYNYLKSISTVNFLDLDEDMESNLSDVSGSITISPNQPLCLFDIGIKQEIKYGEEGELEEERKSSKKRIRRKKHQSVQYHDYQYHQKHKIRKVHHCIASEENMKEFWPKNVTYTNKNHNMKLLNKYNIESVPEEFVEIKPHVNSKIGMGLFAKKLIPKDTYFEYTGKVTKRKDVIVHIPGKHCYVAGMDDLNFDLDASSYGNETRFINHYVGISDVPNVELLKAQFHDGPHILVRTVCDIEPTDELLLDYGPGFGNMINLDADNDRSEVFADEEVEESQVYGTKLDILDGFASLRDNSQYMQGLNDVNIGMYCGTQVAIKKFAKEKRPYLAYHWNRLKKIQHPKLMNVYDCGMLKSSAVMILDFAPLGDLESFLKAFRAKMDDTYYYEKFLPVVAIDVAEASMCLVRHNAQDPCNELRPERIFIFGELSDNNGHIEVRKLQAKVLWSQVDAIIRKLTNRPQTFWLGPPRKCFDEQRRIYTDFARVLIYLIALRVIPDTSHSTNMKEHCTAYLWKQYIPRIDQFNSNFMQIKKDIHVMLDFEDHTTQSPEEKKPEIISLHSDSSEDL